jgi:ribosomal-protein-alanine N-acetyltransferase
MKENYKEIVQNNTHIHTKRLLLRRFTQGDAEDVYSYASDKETLKYLTWSGVEDMEGAKGTITNYYCNDGVYAIELKETGHCIGCIDLLVNPDHEKAGFGYVLNRNYWNQGYMTEVLSAILKFGFETLELNRIEATHYASNPASGKVMEKCGMKKEGYALSEVKIKGIFHDVVHYGITKDQWTNRMDNRETGEIGKL